MKKKILTLSLVLKGGKVLLGIKKKGFGIGKWTGFWGKASEGEKIEEEAKRELKEKIGILAKKLEKRGILRLTSTNSLKEFLEVHVFLVSDFKGDPFKSEEMKLKWFNIDEIPFNQMWPDDKYWLPLVLNRKKFEGSFHFRNNEIIETYTIFEIQET